MGRHISNREREIESVNNALALGGCRALDNAVAMMFESFETTAKIADTDAKFAAESAARLAEIAREKTLQAATDAHVAKIRKIVLARLRRWGFRKQRGAARDINESVYYSLNDFTVRVSNHAVPETNSRWESLERGGFTWANTWRSFAITEKTTEMDVGRWLVEVRRRVRKEETITC